MENRIGTTRKRGINFIVQWTAAKATVAVLFIAIGLIFSNTRAVVIGAAFGGIGLIGLGNLIAWVGFFSTIRRFQALFQGISGDLKRTFGKLIRKLRGLSDQKCPECGHWIPKKVRAYWCRATTSGVTSYEAFDCPNCGRKFRNATPAC